PGISGDSVQMRRTGLTGDDARGEKNRSEYRNIGMPECRYAGFRESPTPGLPGLSDVGDPGLPNARTRGIPRSRNPQVPQSRTHWGPRGHGRPVSRANRLASNQQQVSLANSLTN